MKAETDFRQYPSLLPASSRLSLLQLTTPNSGYTPSPSPRSLPQKRLSGFSEPLGARFTVDIMDS